MLRMRAFEFYLLLFCTVVGLPYVPRPKVRGIQESIQLLGFVI